MKLKSFFKNLICLILIIFFIFPMFGCQNQSFDSKNSKLKITDAAGDEITLNGPANKIACTWPSGTQMMITFGMNDLLVAVPEETKEQPWAVQLAPNIKDLPSCSNEESVENLLNLGADVIITTEADVARDLRSKGANAITINYYSIDEMKNSIKLLKNIVPSKYKSTCDSYITYLDKQVKSVDKALKNKVTNKSTVYYINGNNNKGLYKTAGGDTMNEAWANYAYTDFITSSLLSPSETEVDAEAVLNANPEYVVIGGRYQKVLYDELISSSEWNNINAVTNKNVLTIPLGVSPFDRFGPEFALMIPWLANQVYPDLYSFDTASEIKNFYQTFSNYKMTDKEANYIIKGLMPNGHREIENK